MGSKLAKKPKRPSLTWAIVWTEAAMLPDGTYRPKTFQWIKVPKRGRTR